MTAKNVHEAEQMRTDCKIEIAYASDVRTYPTNGDNVTTTIAVERKRLTDRTSRNYSEFGRGIRAGQTDHVCCKQRMIVFSVAERINKRSTDIDSLSNTSGGRSHHVHQAWCGTQTPHKPGDGGLLVAAAPEAVDDQGQEGNRIMNSACHTIVDEVTGWAGQVHQDAICATCRD